MANKAVGFLTFNFGANLGGFNRAMKKAQRSVRKFGRSIKNMGATMTTSVTMPMIAVGAASVKMAADFGTAMTKIRTLVGASAKELKSYEKDVLALSHSTGVSAEELANGLFFITSAGLKGKEAIEALEISASGAAMQMGEMTDIASALTSVMKAYKNEGMTAAKAGDLIHETLKQGKFEAGEFMQKLGTVIPTAAAAGVSFMELGAAAATMSGLSGNASATLTSMNSLIMKLLNPSAQQTEILKALHISYDDLAQMLETSLMGTLQFIFKGLEGNNDMLLKVFGSSKAVTGALSTMGLQSEDYKRILDGMNNSANNVSKGFEILSEDAGFKLAGAMNSVKLVMIDIGKMVMPLVLKAVRKIEQAMAFLKGLDSDTKQLSMTIGLLAAAVGPLLLVVGQMVIAFSALISPVGLIIAGLSAIAAAFIFLADNWEAVKERLGDWSWWKNSLLQALQWLIEFNPMGIILKTFNTVLEFFGKTKIPNPFDEMSNELEKLKVDTKDYENEFGSFTEAIINQSKNLVEALGLMDNPLKLGGGSGGSGDGEDDSVFVGAGHMETDESYEQFLARTNTQLEHQVSLLEQLANALGTTQESLAAYANEMAISLSSGAESFKEYGEQVKNAIREVISGLIAQGVAAAITKAMSTAVNPLLIPIVAKLASGLAKTAFNQLIPSFADGGIVSGPTVGLMGEYAGAGSGNPEVIAPLNKLKSMIGGGTQKIQLEGRLRGNDIYLSNQNETLNRLRTT